MTYTRWFVCLVMVVAGAACGSDGEEVVVPQSDDFVIDPDDQGDIDDAAERGDSAEGDYSYDEQSGLLTITLSESSFRCGPIEGTFVAIVAELNDAEMVWQFEGGDGGVTWRRVNTDTTGVEGVWSAGAPDLFLILSADGAAQLFGDAGVCDEDDRARNDRNCIELGLSGADINVDGRLADWDAVSASATLTDPAGDHAGDDPGADVRALKAEFARGTLYVLSELDGPLTEDPSLRYRLLVQGDNGLSIEHSLVYDPGSGGFVSVSPSPDVGVASATAGIEWSVDLSSHLSDEGFDALDLIMVEPMDCSGTTCESTDSVDCGYFEIPR